ncbi:hypothetical protein GCM10023322_45590 [Rugosimonospora acidiphila]|uniref:Uncharacterized protein n=1 Tax=Rugosimonospora acidiphila TaxID=556531 RepID=A0ABP9S3N2_9ACTN
MARTNSITLVKAAKVRDIPNVWTSSREDDNHAGGSVFPISDNAANLRMAGWRSSRGTPAGPTAGRRGLARPDPVHHAVGPDPP